MKCPVCWSEKAYRREARSWRDVLAQCLLLVPFKCHHCFHRFYVPWFRTLGQIVNPPATATPDRQPVGISEARRHLKKISRGSDHVSCDYRSSASTGSSRGDVRPSD